MYILDFSKVTVMYKQVFHYIWSLIHYVWYRLFQAFVGNCVLLPKECVPLHIYFVKAVELESGVEARLAMETLVMFSCTLWSKEKSVDFTCLWQMWNKCFKKKQKTGCIMKRIPFSFVAVASDSDTWTLFLWCVYVCAV